MIVKNRLKRIRLSMLIEHQIDMAILLGLRQDRYNRYENNTEQPSLKTALLIAGKLGLPVESIFYLEPGEDM